MKKYISTFLGHDNKSTALKAQKMNVTLAQKSGYEEIKIYPHHREGEAEELTLQKVHYALAGVEEDSLFILQLPTWNIDLQYDELYLRELRKRVDKLVLFIHDFLPLMFENNLGYTEWMLSQYNQADLVILPSRKMEKWMRQWGLISPVIIQGIWDHSSSLELEKQVPFYRGIKFPAGGAQRTEAAKNWTYDIPLEIYTLHSEIEFPNNVIVHPYLSNESLLLELNKGGFGLVWAENTENMPTKNYYTMCHPYKLSTYLAAGLPLIIQKGATSEGFVKNNGIGFAVDTLEEAAQVVRDISEADYMEMQNRVIPISQMVREGFFFNKLLIEIEDKLFLKQEEELNDNL